MDLEKEIELLKEKIDLLEKVKELQDMIKVAERPYTPTIPYQPPYNPWIWYSITSDSITIGGSNESC